ncbi:hypothetical protein XENOCAPTIV_008245 [Xenoophorus captivus]|uniref:Uncharacterized protein n=1 Tax=Xenoophorus captivus TaxID=1517983 RepID=A0ABV0SA60_9TELE
MCVCVCACACVVELVAKASKPQYFPLQSCLFYIIHGEGEKKKSKEMGWWGVVDKYGSGMNDCLRSKCKGGIREELESKCGEEMWEVFAERVGVEYTVAVLT